MESEFVLIVTTREMGIAFVGALGLLTLSLIATRMVKYFVGLGMFGMFFLLTYLITEDLNICVFIGTFMAVFMGFLYEYRLKDDIFLATLVVIMAIIGLVIISVILTTVFKSVNPAFGRITRFALPMKELKNIVKTSNQLKFLK